VDLQETLREVAMPLLRFAAFAGSAIVFGVAPVLLAVFRPTFSELRGDEWAAGRRRVAIRLEGLVRAGLAATAAATAIVLVLQASLVSELREQTVNADAFESVFQTTFGQWYVIRYPIIVGLLILLYRRVSERSLSGAGDSSRAPNLVWWGTWLILGAGLLATSSLAGHAAAAAPRYAVVVNDVVHLCAGATWFAGIVTLCVVLPDAWRRADVPRRLDVLAPAVGRFARVALVSIAIVAATGTLNSFAHLRSWRDLADSGYGRTLIVKLGIFLVVLMLGTVNHWYIARRLERARAVSEPSNLPKLFRRTIAAELVAAVAIMAVTGVLVGLAPTRVTSAPAQLRRGGVTTAAPMP
jgi:copper transport protein